MVKFGLLEALYQVKKEQRSVLIVMLIHGVQFVTTLGVLEKPALSANNLVMDQMVSAFFFVQLTVSHSYYTFILNKITAIALGSAPFGRGDGPIVLDNVYCNSREIALLECGHNGLFTHNCDHREDTGVICLDDQRLIHVYTRNINASIISSTAVTISWELQNNMVDEPRLFEVECSSERHSATILESNRTFTTQLGGLLASTPYNCCVSAVYDLYATRKLCTPVLISDTTVQLSKHASNSTNVVGGVLGFIIVVLMILLAILGTHTIVVYLIKLKQHKREIPSIR